MIVSNEIFTVLRVFGEAAIDVVDLILVFTFGFLAALNADDIFVVLCLFSDVAAAASVLQVITF